MRAFGRLGAVPGGRPTAHAAAAAYSTFSGGGGGIGRGRGRGSGPPPPRVPGQPIPDGENEDHGPPGVGRGRAQPVLPSSPVLPSFSSGMSSAPPAGRGRGRFEPPPAVPSETSADSHSRGPIFFKREDVAAAPEDKPESADADKGRRLPRSLSPGFSGAGRGKPSGPLEPESRPPEENRHLRQRPAPRPGQEISSKTAGQPKMGREEAVKKAVEVLSRGGPGGGRGPGRGRGGRGMFQGRGRGRGGRSRGRGMEEDDEDISMYLGDNADGQKLEKRLGEERMKQLSEAFEQTSWSALPSPMDDAYLEAIHTNNMIEYEPEYLVDFDNPDIDEKPPMSLLEALEKAKPFLMAYDGIQSQEEWEEAIEETMKRLPHMKELMDMYCGPDRVTAKQQQQELERVAKTLPENIPVSVKRFADRAVLSLQSNPGWGWDKKCQFMDKLALDVTKHYSK